MPNIVIDNLLKSNGIFVAKWNEGSRRAFYGQLFILSGDSSDRTWKSRIRFFGTATVECNETQDLFRAGVSAMGRGVDKMDASGDEHRTPAIVDI